MNVAQRMMILLIRGYQAVLSPALAVFFGPAGRCRYTPTCSAVRPGVHPNARRAGGRRAGGAETLPLPSVGRVGRGSGPAS